MGSPPVSASESSFNGLGPAFEQDEPSLWDTSPPGERLLTPPAARPPLNLIFMDAPPSLPMRSSVPRDPAGPSTDESTDPRIDKSAMDATGARHHVAQDDIRGRREDPAAPRETPSSDAVISAGAEAQPDRAAQGHEASFAETSAEPKTLPQADANPDAAEHLVLAAAHSSPERQDTASTASPSMLESHDGMGATRLLHESRATSFVADPEAEEPEIDIRASAAASLAPESASASSSLSSPTGSVVIHADGDVDVAGELASESSTAEVAVESAVQGAAAGAADGAADTPPPPRVPPLAIDVPVLFHMDDPARYETVSPVSPSKPAKRVSFSLSRNTNAIIDPRSGHVVPILSCGDLADSEPESDADAAPAAAPSAPAPAAAPSHPPAKPGGAHHRSAAYPAPRAPPAAAHEKGDRYPAEQRSAAPAEPASSLPIIAESADLPRSVPARRAISEPTRSGLPLNRMRMNRGAALPAISRSDAAAASSPATAAASAHATSSLSSPPAAPSSGSNASSSSSDAEAHAASSSLSTSHMSDRIKSMLHGKHDPGKPPLAPIASVPTSKTVKATYPSAPATASAASATPAAAAGSPAPPRSLPAMKQPDPHDVGRGWNGSVAIRRPQTLVSVVSADIVLPPSERPKPPPISSRGSRVSSANASGHHGSAAASAFRLAASSVSQTFNAAAAQFHASSSSMPQRAESLHGEYHRSAHGGHGGTSNGPGPMSMPMPMGMPLSGAYPPPAMHYGMDTMSEGGYDMGRGMMRAGRGALHPGSLHLADVASPSGHHAGVPTTLPPLAPYGWAPHPGMPTGMPNGMPMAYGQQGGPPPPMPGYPVPYYAYYPQQYGYYGPPPVSMAGPSPMYAPLPGANGPHLDGTNRGHGPGMSSESTGGGTSPMSKMASTRPRRSGTNGGVGVSGSYVLHGGSSGRGADDASSSGMVPRTHLSSTASSGPHGHGHGQPPPGLYYAPMDYASAPPPPMGYAPAGYPGMPMMYFQGDPN